MYSKNVINKQGLRMHKASPVGSNDNIYSGFSIILTKISLKEEQATSHSPGAKTAKASNGINIYLFY